VSNRLGNVDDIVANKTFSNDLKNDADTSLDIDDIRFQIIMVVLWDS
jgi:hypothetical protein